VNTKLLGCAILEDCNVLGTRIDPLTIAGDRGLHSHRGTSVLRALIGQRESACGSDASVIWELAVCGVDLLLKDCDGSIAAPCTGELRLNEIFANIAALRFRREPRAIFTIGLRCGLGGIKNEGETWGFILEQTNDLTALPYRVLGALQRRITGTVVFLTVSPAVFSRACRMSRLIM